MIYPIVPFPVTFNLDFKVSVIFRPIDALNVLRVICLQQLHSCLLPLSQLTLIA